jgi:hypothetical protein
MFDSLSLAKIGPGYSRGLFTLQVIVQYRIDILTAVAFHFPQSRAEVTRLDEIRMLIAVSEHVAQVTNG